MALVSIRPDTLYAWHGPSLLIVNTHGACADDVAFSGYYFREARHLRLLRFEINGVEPWLCDAACTDVDRLDFTFVHPEIQEPGGGGSGQSADEEKTDKRGIPERALDIRVTYKVGVDALNVRALITNRSLRAVTFDVAWHVEADYSDLLETQGGGRQQQADVDVVSNGREMSLAYAHPQLPYRTRLEGGGAEWGSDRTRLRANVRLEPAQTAELTLRVAAYDPATPLSADDVRARDEVLQQWRAGLARVEAPGNRIFERALANNVRDIASFPLLEGQPDEWLTPQAGMPLYPAFFGRDAVTAGWQAAYLDSGRGLDAALTRLSRMQTDRTFDWRDEQLGRLPYQVRSGPLARLNKNPYSAYYADYATPLMFVVALANLFAWTGEVESVKRHLDTARRVLDWARDYGDGDHDGYLEYLTRSSDGTKNQGWKDSGDAVVYEDGRAVPAPIATCELQGYWYIAQRLMAFLCFATGAARDAAAYNASADALKARFNRDWWVPEEHCVAFAMDPHKQLVRAVTSNVGHCIACGIIEAEHLPAVVGRLFAPDMFSGWGIRTLSSNHKYYNPISYHRGSVWAVEQATTMFGLRRFGFDARALDLARAMFDLAQLYPVYRIPECIGGYAQSERPVPGAYPRANAPQLWNATAFPLMLQTLLGILPLAPVETLIIDPVLPAWLPDVVVHDLRVGRATVTLRFWRKEDGDSSWDVVSKRGTLRVVRQPPPESLSAHATDRAWGSSRASSR